MFLKQLELINFDIGKYFHRHLARCENIETLLLVPTYYEVEFEGTNHQLVFDRPPPRLFANALIEIANLTDTIVPSDIIMIEDPVTTEILTGRLQFLETVVDSELVELLPNTRFSILKVPFKHVWRVTVPEGLLLQCKKTDTGSFSREFNLLESYLIINASRPSCRLVI
ncbi:hypothetical protein J6590_089547 [Homalodisca vitripennis]|nr:hypothetical protein J6590_089547 [Homalodisca vitripennis]